MKQGIESNHQTSFDQHVQLTNGDVSTLVAPIESALGHEIQVPDFGQAAFVKVGNYHLNPDFIRHAYAMHRIAGLGFSKKDRILEIGGGFGCVARYGVLKGFEDITIVDLPFANAVQAGFIAGTLGEDCVSFQHEKVKNGKVCVFPSTCKEELQLE